MSSPLPSALSLKTQHLNCLVTNINFLSSQEHLDRMDDVGLLVPLVELLGVEDVLVRLNAIELITNVALTHQGLR